MKYLKISLVDRKETEDLLTKNICQMSCNIYDHEFPNIYYDNEITQEEVDDAIDTLITYFMQKRIQNINVDLKARDDQYAKENINYEEIKSKLDELAKNNDEFIKKIKDITKILDNAINLTKED